MWIIFFGGFVWGVGGFWVVGLVVVVGVVVVGSQKLNLILWVCLVLVLGLVWVGVGLGWVGRLDFGLVLS